MPKHEVKTVELSTTFSICLRTFGKRATTDETTAKEIELKLYKNKLSYSDRLLKLPVAWLPQLALGFDEILESFCAFGVSLLPNFWVVIAGT